MRLCNAHRVIGGCVGTVVEIDLIEDDALFKMRQQAREGREAVSSSGCRPSVRTG